ncbi:MAG: hypothetical protein KIT25_18385 [Enhydrobacter sp.]|nr:MAG: hypothetical protein KIT25_18385 [Enhydrobacter sp.]
MIRVLIVLLVAMASVPTAAQHGGHGAAAPYAGQQVRAIKSLSAEDVEELRRGGGWGLAKVAELNGVPGPAHVLELADRIGLSAEQVASVRAVFERMRVAATREGERLIGLEMALETSFRERTVTDETLRRALGEIERSRLILRYIHLAAHLETASLLMPPQIALYNDLRGYGADPCRDVPVGHDPVLWRRHNGCR